MSNDDKRGKLLSELRKGKNLTQRDLGNLIGYTDKNISKWERGISFPNNPNIINKLAEIFEISVEELMYGELRGKANETEIRENFANQYKNNYNKYRKNILIIIISFLLFVIISLILIYFIYIKNSISVYSLIIEDNNFNCSGFGEVSPSSQFDIVCLVTSTFSANCSCESLQSFLNFKMLSPNFILSLLSLTIIYKLIFAFYQMSLELCQRLLTIIIQITIILHHKTKAHAYYNMHIILILLYI